MSRSGGQEGGGWSIKIGFTALVLLGRVVVCVGGAVVVGVCFVVLELECCFCVLGRCGGACVHLSYCFESVADNCTGLFRFYCGLGFLIERILFCHWFADLLLPFG